MQLSTAYKQQLLKAARIASAGAIAVSSIGSALAPNSFAAALTANKTLIADSRLSTGGGNNVTYTIDFTPSVSTTAIKQVNVEFCTTADSYDNACTAPTGLAVPADISGSSASGFGGGGAGSATSTFTQTAANKFNLVWTTPALESAVTHEMVLTNYLTNSSVAGTYYTRLKTYSDTGTTGIDEGVSAFAIVSKVQVTGRVLESMTFTVGQVNSGVQCGTGDTATITSSATTIQFGNFLSGTPRVGCQTVTTATNAVSGYTTTLKEVLGGASPIGGMCRQTSTGCSTDGADGTAAATDVIVDTVLNGTPAAWTAGTTFGVGVNANGAEKNTSFTLATDYRGIFGATPIAVAGKTSPTTGTATYIVFKADVNSAQVAGVYQNTLEYVSTPTF